MQFQVPQFIEIEDKIFGPLTFKQFVYVAGGAGAAFIAWTYLPHWIAIFLVVPILALAFYKVNNRPFINTLEAAFRYSFGKKLYVWKRVEKTPTSRTPPGGQTPVTNAVAVPKLSQSRLRDLSWSLDVQERVK